MTIDVLIRNVSIDDVPALSELSRQLGYAVSFGESKDRIRSLLESPNHFVYVADLKQEVVGFVHGVLQHRLTSDSFLEIVALVVDEHYRGLGIGKQLVNIFRITDSNACTIRVRSNTKRKQAHKFFRTLGFELRKDQKVFERNPI